MNIPWTPFIHYVWKWDQHPPSCVPTPVCTGSTILPNLTCVQLTHAGDCKPALSYTLYHLCSTWAKFMINSCQLTSLLFLELDPTSLFPAKIKPDNISREAGSTCLIDAGGSVGLDVTALIFIVLQTDIHRWEPRQECDFAEGKKKKLIWVDKYKKESARLDDRIDLREENVDRNKLSNMFRVLYVLSMPLCMNFKGDLILK